ncbi:DUF4082 domain-containing protein [Iningainema tapete]|uniref:DUF4082 domain-containing protein n=1 Tax=Iningainema tapete BLCC-T55 TaxID=2748662 RepID=A0A8J6XSQ3_9CYAN|nr:DUF4082 domain-containing protein [Iningainema tapete]MBD2778872.1 DUF4082 domain-containing protein [Iningainema tapete BLCC-T55]
MTTITKQILDDGILIAQDQPSQTIFGNLTPSNADVSDGETYQLGLKFQSAQAGQITAIRYWKAVSETGSHIGKIWTLTGEVLASVSFSNETASGWQQAALSTPLNIQANTTYIVSVNVNSHFAITTNGLASSVANGVLSTVADGNNGVYGTVNSFPTNSFQNSNYFRDIVFVSDVRVNPTPTNPIYLENQKPGTTDWKITNQASFMEIAGYAGATSVNKGESLPIKVSLAKDGNFTIEVYRLGYYRGTGGRLILTSSQIQGIHQPECQITDSDTRLVECNWSTSYTLEVGADWTSGLYIAKLIDQNSGKQSQVWFVVRDDSSNSDVLFQSSFNTFLAYNNAYVYNGTRGYSLYEFNSFDKQRAFKVSYDRPFAQTLKDAQGEFNNILRWEYNMVRWLESQSYDVSYVTNLDVHYNSQLLLKHKVFLSVGHDEYWSKEQRDHVELARDAGVNLAFFSANTAYWRVRFENSTINGQPNRVMVCYKGAASPSEPTDKFRSQLNNRPESALLGVMYVGDEDAVYAGFDFVVKNSNDPYYANTGLKDNDTLGKLVGFEWDRINTNASPNGLVILGESQFPGAREELDNTDIEGFPDGTDPRIAHAVRYTAPSGAKVFSTGSIQWMWGLDSDGVSEPREDPRAKQIAVNILADMGAIPLTPSAGIIVPSVTQKSPVMMGSRR